MTGGGDGYCYLDFFPLPDKIRVSLIHVGENPIKDLNVYLSDVTFFLDESDPRRSSIAENAARNSRLINLPTVGRGYREMICTIPISSTATQLYWVATFKTSDGLKKWFQRVLFKPYKDHDFMKGFPSQGGKQMFSATYPHWVYTQVYDYVEENVPGQLKIRETGQIINTKTTYVQQVRRECLAPGANRNIEWSDIHIGYNEQSFFQKVVYLEGAKDCGQAP